MSKWTEARDAFWAKVRALCTSLETRIETLFTASAAAVAKAVEEQAPKIVGDVETFLDKAAHDAVTQAENAPADVKGQDKMALALSLFFSTLKSVGLTLAETEGRSLLENALIAIKLAL